MVSKTAKNGFASSAFERVCVQSGFSFLHLHSSDCSVVVVVAVVVVVVVVLGVVVLVEVVVCDFRVVLK